MGYWGEGLFQNDYDLDILCDLADEAGVDSLYVPENLDAVRDTLDDGTLKCLLARYKLSNAHCYCILAASAMKIGAKIDEEDMTHLRRVYPRAGLLGEGTKQMKKGLDGYKNDGTPWDFESLGLLDTMALSMSSQAPQSSAPQSGGPGFTLMNVFPEGTFQGQLMKAFQEVSKFKDEKKAPGEAAKNNAQDGEADMKKHKTDTGPDINKDQAKQWLNSL